MRQTYCVPAIYSHSGIFQPMLDAMWNLIENHYEEDWRVAVTGDLELTVDEAMLVRIVADNYVVALSEFGAFEEHNPEHQKWEWHNLPEELQGTYIIRGVYDANQNLVNRAREYFFVQEGY